MTIRVAALLSGLLLTASAQANLIVNGGFEAPELSPGSWNVFASIPGWTAFGPGIEIQRSAAGAPFEGAQLVELDSHGNSGMWQNVNLELGQFYDLSFAYSPRPNVPITSNTVEVWIGQFGSVILLDTIQSSGGSETSWTVKSYVVAGGFFPTTIEFRAAGTSDSLGGYIDAVCVVKRGDTCSTQVAEPSSLALAVLALLALALPRKLRV